MPAVAGLQLTHGDRQRIHVSALAGRRPRLHSVHVVAGWLLDCGARSWLRSMPAVAVERLRVSVVPVVAGCLLDCVALSRLRLVWRLLVGGRHMIHGQGHMMRNIS